MKTRRFLKIIPNSTVLFESSSFLILSYFDQIIVLSFIFVYYLCVFKSFVFKFEISSQNINLSVIFVIIFVYPHLP